VCRLLLATRTAMLQPTASGCLARYGYSCFSNRQPFTLHGRRAGTLKKKQAKTLRGAKRYSRPGIFLLGGDRPPRPLGIDATGCRRWMYVAHVVLPKSTATSVISVCSYFLILLCGHPPYEGAALCVPLCLSVCLSVCPSVPLSLPSVTYFRPR